MRLVMQASSPFFPFRARASGLLLYDYSSGPSGLSLFSEPPPMKIDQFLRHHGIASNPLSEEDAQTDAVFKQGCLWRIHHPAWLKFFGSPAEPSTALVFGEKGSGKTAMRLQAAAEIEAFNQAHPTERVFVVSYD